MQKDSLEALKFILVTKMLKRHLQQKPCTYSGIAFNFGYYFNYA